MVRNRTVAPAERSSGDSNVLLHAIIGAVITVVTAPALPVAAVVGGAAAGYLGRGRPIDGAKVGALSGVIAAIPAFLIAWLIVGALLIGANPFLALSSVFALVLFVVVVGYLVGAGALGGAIGAYLRKEL